RVEQFQASWLEEDIFKGWLIPHSTENRAICTTCDVTIQCYKTKLIEHSQTDTHIENTHVKNAQNESKTITESATLTYENKVKRAEIKLTAFIVEHNIPFHAVDRLIPLIKEICKDPTVISSLSLNLDYTGTGTSNMQVTDKCEVDEIDEMTRNLQTCKFSLLMDENTNDSKRILCILVRYVSPQDKTVTTQLLTLICIDQTDPVDKFFEEFKNLLKKKRIPLQNIVAVAGNNSSMMDGCNSVIKHLQSKMPDIIKLNCIDHSVAIVVDTAYAHIPESCKDFIQIVASYISDNVEEFMHLNEFKDTFNAETNKILRSPKKWLVLHKCIVKITGNWVILKDLFLQNFISTENNATDDTSKSIKTLSKQFNNDLIKAYLLFLNYSLYFFNDLNMLYQSHK
ncbi:hypothetical protein EAI_00952, partial [Harpegnathos saltator]